MNSSNIEQLNLVQHSIILDLTQKLKDAQEKISHLESLLLAKAYIIEVDKDVDNLQRIDKKPSH